MPDLVLVTGASGFIAKHIVLHLIHEGYRVRGTVRSAAKADEIHRLLVREGCDLSLFEPALLDLERDEGWAEAAGNCRYVLHTASPFPSRQPAGKFDLVPTARDGTVRAIRAAADAGAERAVVTSSVAAIFYGHADDLTRMFGEGDFSQTDSPTISPYAISKTVAEEAAWQEAGERDLPLATINPALVLGPVLDGSTGTSAKLMRWLARGRVPALPDVTFGIADVRDVAAAHVEAMRRPTATGRRFIVSGGERNLRDVARLARSTTRRRSGVAPLPFPSRLIRLGGRWSAPLAMLAAEVDRVKRLDTSPLTDILDIEPRDPDLAIRTMVESIDVLEAH